MDKPMILKLNIREIQTCFSAYKLHNLIINIRRNGEFIHIVQGAINSYSLYGTVQNDILFISGSLKCVLREVPNKKFDSSGFVETMLVEKLLTTTTTVKQVFSLISLAENIISIAKSFITSYRLIDKLFGGNQTPLSKSELIQEGRKIVYAYIEEACVNGKVGVFGGGGLDSTTLIGICRKLGVETSIYAAGYDQQYIAYPDVCELRRSRSVASYYDIPIFETHFSPSTIKENLENLGSKETSIYTLYYTHMHKYFFETETTFGDFEFLSGYYVDTLFNPKRIMKTIKAFSDNGSDYDWIDVLGLNITLDEVKSTEAKVRKDLKETLEFYRMINPNYAEVNCGFVLENNSNTNMSDTFPSRMLTPFGIDKFCRLIVENADVDALDSKMLFKDMFKDTTYPQSHNWGKMAQGTPFTSYFDLYLKDYITKKLRYFGLTDKYIDKLLSHQLRHKLIQLVLYRYSLEENYGVSV